LSGALSFGPVCDRHWRVRVGGWSAGLFVGLFVLLLASFTLLIFFLIVPAAGDGCYAISSKPDSASACRSCPISSSILEACFSFRNGGPSKRRCRPTAIPHSGITPIYCRAKIL
jgi:hypothetical protein